ncbi:hypothetical protein HMPREF1069_04976 [Bacteroides ovatus CL02T12C04]|nr:hypothetical protein HMPREF1069_04976 [Bacteroides ovatus CL02T12C04]
MNRFLCEANGCHTLAFLTLNIDPLENFELLMPGEGVSERSEALFLREYAHLLQGTVSGLINIAVVDYMKWATSITKKARKQESKKGTLHFPCIPKIEVGHNSYPNDELRKICVGDAYIKDAHGNPVS